MVELMLALGLMGLVMSVVLGVFLRSGRETDLELRRSGQLGQSIALISQLEASLAQGDTARRRLLDALLAEALAPDDEGSSASRKPELADA